MVSGQPDAGEPLGASLPHLLPERVVEVASAQAGCPVAAYVLDVEGSFAVRLAGDVERFPERIRAPVGVGPEIIPEALPQLRGLVIDQHAVAVGGARSRDGFYARSRPSGG